MPVIETKGALSSQGYGEFAQSGAGPVYVEDVFSTWLYTGNGSARNIQNGISFGTTGGLIGGSVSFDGSGDYMEVADQSLFNLGNSAYTIEFFVYPTSFSSSCVPLAYQWSNSGGTRLIAFIQNTDATYTVYFNNAGNVFTSTNTVTLNQWNHIALVRSSNTFTLYINGTSGASAVAAITYSDSSFPIVIGASYDNSGAGVNSYFGSISNLRVATGNAVYTANFVPPTAPLTAVAGTRLLTCQTPNPVLDYSGNNFPITVVGAVAQTTGGPFTEFTQNKPGMVWFKSRSAATNNQLFDSVRGPALGLSSNSTAAQTTETTGLTSFNSNGFTIGSSSTINQLAALYASWTFRKQAKFFDVVTYTGNGAGNAQNIPHSLGSVPGCIIIKIVNSVNDWPVYHRSLGATNGIYLNRTDAAFGSGVFWNNTAPTSTEFTVKSDANTLNQTYVAYLFAHDAGGFGAAGSDNVISCGSYTGNGSATGPTVTLGYEPQFLILKAASGGTSGSQDWNMVDNMRGWTVSSNAQLNPNLSAAETQQNNVALTSTGFRVTTAGADFNGNGNTYIYIAIRRGPMKTPTTGTSVFQPVVYTGTNVDNRLVTTGILTDFIMARQRNSTTLGGMLIGDRLRGDQYWLTGSTAVGVTDADSLMTPTLSYGNSFSAMNGFGCGNDATAQLNISTVASNQVVEAFARAPGFLDVVTYTGTGSATAFSHNLGVKPEMMWVKRLNVSVANSVVYTSTVGASGYLQQNSAGSATYSATIFNNTEPTSTQFTVATATNVNTGANNYVAYLMASVPGVSRCSYYVGRDVGNSHQVDCGFTGGARFVLIKSVGSSGSWFVYDSARGIVSGNDPYILLDSTGAEDTATDYIDSYSAGFEVSATAIDGLNRGYARDWNQQAAVAGAANFQDIAYAGGQWVAVTNGGNAYYSTTGYSWTTVASIMGGAAYGLTYGNGLYVAVGATGRISTSPDAITWTARTSGVAVVLNGAGYGLGKYWAVGNTGTLISSTDGITWSTVSLGTTENLERVRFLNGVLIIVGANGTLITSTDGTTFTTRTTGVTTSLQDVTFGNSTYVVVGFSGTIITSTDLSTWTTRSAGALAGNTIYGVAYAGYRFVAVATSGETGYSNDGVTWSTGAGAGTNPLYSVAYGNDLVIAGNGDGDLFTSDVRYFFWAIA